MTTEEAIQELRGYKQYCRTMGFRFNDWREALDMAIEALERKRGEWIETSESIGWEEVGCAECSVCGKILVLGDYTMDDIKFNYNYCPNCGAEMEHD